MKRKLLLIVAAVGIFMSLGLNTQAQSADLPRYELAADFSSLSLDSGTSLPGVGGRFTYNLNKHLALEAAGYFFPGKCDGCTGEVTGHVTEGLFGVKAGKRFKKWGVFGKARPGFMSFGQQRFTIIPVSAGAAQSQCFGASPTSLTSCFRFEQSRLTHIALDVGGVLEFYPSNRIVVRFDGGDTIIFQRQQNFDTLMLDSGVIRLVTIPGPGRTRHSFQFTAGVGFRF
ncbi:MAG TPA: hypothetical protein VK475_12675 [Pyrinomonadaceae bacterium]|nr:hypothetical protein [Pyrinomonadaceae bacterium]